MKRLLWLAIIVSAIVAPAAQAPAPAGLDAAIRNCDNCPVDAGPVAARARSSNS